MQEWKAQESIDIALLLLGTDTSTGEFLSALLESPSCPFQFSPQHITFRSTVITHVWKDPAETLSAPVPPNEEYVGLCLSVFVPSPS